MCTRRLENWLLLSSTPCVPGIKLTSSGLASSASTHWTISATPTQKLPRILAILGLKLGTGTKSTFPILSLGHRALCSLGRTISSCALANSGHPGLKCQILPVSFLEFNRAQARSGLFRGNDKGTDYISLRQD